MSNNNKQLPKDVVEEIKMSAKKAAAAFIKKTPKKVISRVGLENICAASYGAGAAAYATKLHLVEQERDDIKKEKSKLERNELVMITLLKEVFEKHESGLLPDRFIYEKIKRFLNGE